MALLEKQTKQSKGKTFTTSKSITVLWSEIHLSSHCERFQVSYGFSYQLWASRHIKDEAFLYIYIYASTYHVVPGKARSQAIISLSTISMGECRQRPCSSWQAAWTRWLLLPQATLDGSGGRFIPVRAPSGGSRKMPLMHCGLRSPHDHLGSVWLTAV